jgi:hypothetical protein
VFLKIEGLRADVERQWNDGPCRYIGVFFRRLDFSPNDSTAVDVATLTD